MNTPELARRLSTVLALIAGTGCAGSGPHTTDDTDGISQADADLLATCLVPATWTPSWEGQHLVKAQDCIVVAADAPCPTAATPLPWTPEALGALCATSGVTCVTGFVERRDILRDTGFIDTDAPPDSVNYDACCYDYVGPLPDYVCGRPWMVDGQPSTAPCVAGAGWALTALTAIPRAAADRDAAVARWVADARAEHASIAAFARLTLDLLAHAAPASLVQRTQAALQDEVRHAADAFTLASALAGTPLAPGALPVAANPAPSLVELAVATAVEGGVGELLAAATAAARLSVATDPTVRAMLERVVTDEARHALLAWDIVAWAVAQGGDAVRVAVDRAVADAVAVLPPVDEERFVPSHGLCGAVALRAAHLRVLAELDVLAA